MAIILSTIELLDEAAAAYVEDLQCGDPTLCAAVEAETPARLVSA